MSVIKIGPIDIEPKEGESSARAIGVTVADDIAEFVVMASNSNDGSYSIRRAPTVRPLMPHRLPRPATKAA